MSIVRRVSIILCLVIGVVVWWISPADCIAGFSEKMEFGEGPTIPLAWDDLNMDGYPDIVVGNFNSDNQIFFQTENGEFTEYQGLGTGSATFAVTSADFDNDGDPDVAIGNGYNQQNKLFINNGDGSFVEQDTFGSGRTIAMAWADYDQDGDLDLAAGNGILGKEEQNVLFVNDGNDTFTAQNQFGIGQTGTMVWGDCDNDGDPDLAVGNGGFSTAGQNYLYINNGDGTFNERAEFGMGDTASMVWGDCDNDGDLDLAVGNWGSDSQNYLYVNDGTGRFTGSAQFGSLDTNTIAWGDANNDGRLDLAVGNGDFQNADQNYLYLNMGNGVFNEMALFGQGSTDAVVWCDYDIDGDLDLAVGNEHSPTQNYLYENDHADDSRPMDYLQIILRGHPENGSEGFSNRDGIGTRIAIYSAGFLGEPACLLGFREHTAHGGFSSQNTRVEHFGVPGESTVDIRVQWPGSAGKHWVQHLMSVSSGRQVIVEETSPELGVHINMPVTVHPGEKFRVCGYLNNPGDPRVQVPVFFILDVFGELFFWPTWTAYSPPENTAVDYRLMDVPTGISAVNVLPMMTWPDTGSARLDGLFFYGAMLNQDMTDILGQMAVTEWSFGP